jgi:hypothetical protein
MNETPGPGAAAVAAQLLEFFREPALHRPAWIHGEAPLPEGHVVLKFALGRFSPGWQRDLPKHDKEALIEAARAFVRQVCLWDRATHYQLLCLERDASVDSIRENYRLLMALMHPDRQPTSQGDAWPVGCAQRVNEAYAVLSEGARRAQYDQELGHVQPLPAFEPDTGSDAHRRRMTRRPPVLRTFAIVSGVVVILFVVQAWWMTDTPKHYGLLERTIPAHSSMQWMREVIASGLPRFLETKSAVAFEPIELLQAPKAPRRLSAWVPASEARAEEGIAPSATSPPGAIAPLTATDMPPQRFAGPAALSAPSTPPRLALAQSTEAPAAVAPRAAAPASPSAQDIELLVARVVSYYEQGDAGALMGLYASGEPGFFKGMRVRSAYSDFFRATKDRRLRMDRLDWQTAPDTAHARGTATLTAEYADGSGMLERSLPVELDIAMRDGQARLTRLSLYPETK